MELTIAMAISILGAVVSVSSFVLNRKDKSNDNVKEEVKEFSKHDLIEYRLSKIEENIEKILNKLDFYDKEIEDKVNQAIKNHEKIYHRSWKNVN